MTKLACAQEGANAEYFTASIASTPLAGVVFSPRVLKEYRCSSSDNVISYHTIPYHTISYDKIDSIRYILIY